MLGVAVLGLVLGLTLRSKDDGGGDGPTPDIPVNPYFLEGELNDQIQVFTGVLSLETGAYNKMKKSGQKMKGKTAENNVTLLDPTTIPTGENNKLLDKISFEIGQSDFKTSYLWLSD